MLLARLRRLVTGRQRSQGLVEYGLITACLAFVGIAGFNALAGAQRDYLATFPRNAAPPAAPGALLHPTSVDLPICNPPGPTIKVGTPVSCSAVVRDDYVSNPPDKRPPAGTLDFELNGASIGTCTMPTLPSGSSNTCTLPTFTPTNSQVGSYKLTATYTVPTSNHIASVPSPGLPLKFVYNIIWAQLPTCVNDLPVGLPSGQVEIGHPFDCTATIQDGSGANPPFSGLSQPITWSTLNGPAQTGVGMFTCSGTYSDIWNATKCPQPTYTGPTTSYSCALTCAVIYRRLYDSNSNGVGNTLPLTVVAVDPVFGDTKSVPIQIMPQVATDATHPTGTVAVCTSTDKNVTPQNDPDGTVHYFDVNFRTTHDLDVSGGTVGNPNTGTAILCTATVYDASSNNPAVTNPVIPDKDEAYPPMGTVKFKYTDGSTAPSVVATCSVFQSYTAGAPIVQAPGQAPFVSTCQSSAAFSVTGTVVCATCPSNPQPTLTVEYETEGAVVGGPTHGVSSYTINVDFRP